ncbi:MAG: TonB family protein [Phenylobacterium sp.]|nr:MAG: TonB family protein [Phenylobacterium sp.]
MSIVLLALLTAAATGPAPAAAPPATPPTEVSPVVVTGQPNRPPPADVTVSMGDGTFVRGQDVSIWPAAARAAGVGGTVTLTCEVDVHGLAQTCRVAYEQPRGQGFGAAALELRPTFKLTPRQGPDGPVAGPMNIAVNFKPSEMEIDLRRIQETSSKVLDHPIASRSVTLMDWPAWTRAPGFEDWAAAYPAKGGGVEGYAVAHCKVQPTGALTRCVVEKELPTGHDFGKAAVALAGQFTVSPETMARAPRGAPIEVDVPVRFPPPAEAKDRTVREPFWIVGSDPRSLMRDFPAGVAKPGSPGAQVACEVGADGALTGCRIELTSPDGLDFDDAAVRLASRLKMNLWSAEAGPVQGGVVHLPVRLDMASAE